MVGVGVKSVECGLLGELGFILWKEGETDTQNPAHTTQKSRT